jgi:hypothetical protein
MAIGGYGPFFMYPTKPPRSAAGQLVAQIGQRTLDCVDSPNPGSPPPFEPPQPRSLWRCEVAPGPRWPLPSYFCAISFRCQANKVSGVTMVASARSFRPNPLAFAAHRRRWSS